jgi:acyl-coenzyme A thioesterase PaaI-like protein
MEEPQPALDRLAEALRTAEAELAALAPTDLTPRLGEDPRPDQRVYLDHGHDVGAYNPCFPEYELTVDAGSARGTVVFPLAFEGPPGVVHGGVIASFFDCVVQHHNCLLGQAGKTTSLQVRFRRPTPVGLGLRFEIDRGADQRRITSEARLLDGSELLAQATLEAVAGDRAALPAVSPRR